MPSEFSRVVKILADNIEKPFVKRITNKKDYPELSNEDGTVSTHSMAADVDDETGKWLVYPTVVEDGDGLRRMEQGEAMKRAKKTGDMIEFEDGDEALWFSERYKVVWGEE